MNKVWGEHFLRTDINLLSQRRTYFYKAHFCILQNIWHGIVCLCCIEAMDFLGLLVKNLPASAGDAGSIPEWGRSPGGGNGNPLQCSCLENSRDRGAWLTTVHGVTKSQIWLSNQACTMNKCSLSECLHHKMAYTIFFYPRITWKIFQLTVGLHG